ncbi:MAG TPA: alpha/beta hydrolase, partial [Pyrinomonadaceae bacterium]
DPRRFALMRLFGSPVVGDVVAPLLISSRRLLRRRMKRVYDRHAWVLDERRVEARHRPLRTRASHRAIIRTIRRWDAERVSLEAYRIKQPTLLMWGETDQEVPIANGERLQKEIEDSRLIVFRECGHLPHEEYPQAFVEVTRNFCAEELERNQPAAVAG